MEAVVQNLSDVCAQQTVNCHMGILFTGLDYDRAFREQK